MIAKYVQICLNDERISYCGNIILTEYNFNLNINQLKLKEDEEKLSL